MIKPISVYEQILQNIRDFKKRVKKKCNFCCKDVDLAALCSQHKKCQGEVNTRKGSGMAPLE